MASIIFIARGINQQFEIWKTFMQSQLWPWKRKNLNICKCGATKQVHEQGATLCPKFEPMELNQRVQGSLRPIQIFEYVVPEECIPEVLAMQNLHQIEKYRPEIETIAWPLRKAMGLKKINIPDDIKKKTRAEITEREIPMQGMGVYAIGYKEDQKGPINFGPNQDFDQEQL